MIQHTKSRRLFNGFLLTMTTAAFLGTNFLPLLTALTPALTACCAMGPYKPVATSPKV